MSRTLTKSLAIIWRVQAGEIKRREVMLDPQLRDPRRDQEQGRGSWDQKAGLPSASVSQQLCKGRTSPDTEQSTFLYELLRSRNNYQMKRCGLGRTEPRAQLHLSPGSACSLALTYVFGPPHPPVRPPPPLSQCRSRGVKLDERYTNQ